MSGREKRVARIVAKIKESGFRCALTGWTISESCFELDHIVSIHDGGSDEVDNLQAVHPLVNRAKGTMGNQQFIDMCRAVVAYQDDPSGAELSELVGQIKDSIHPPSAKLPLEG